MATTTKTKTKTEPVAEPKPTARKRISLDSDVRLNVRSNQYCTLGFSNGRNGGYTQWSGINDMQVLKVEDIEYMRSNAVRFLSDTWIVIESVVDDEYADLTREEIYKALGIERFYNTGIPKNLNEVVKWDIPTIEARTAGMNQDTKDTILTALNTEVINGNLVDIRLIHAWEKALGTKLETDEVE